MILAQEKPEFYESVLTLVINGEEVNVKVKAIQRHPVRYKLIHLDFVRV
ncbi:Ribosomal L25p family [Aeromonas veronii B565]|nr:Ribosomal L25p family [Aeromonas veronii B565]